MSVVSKISFGSISEISDKLRVSLFGKFWLGLISLAVLIPRELNIRFKGLSFSITDLVFVILVVSGLFLKIYQHTENKFQENIFLIFVFLPILTLIFVSLFDIFFKGISNYHIFFRDIYIFSIFPFTFLIVFYLGFDNQKLILLLFILLTLLSIWAIMVVHIPLISRWFVEIGKQYEVIGGSIGYFMPSGGKVGPLLETGKIRPAILIGGGGHLGWFILFCIPLFFGYLEFLRKKLGFILTSICFVLILVSFLDLMSKAAILGLTIAVIFWMFSSSPLRVKLSCISFIFIAILFFTLSGGLSSLNTRFAELKSPQQIAHAEKKWPSSTSMRFMLYSEALRYIYKDPLLGIGMGNSFKITLFKNTNINWFDKFDGVDSFYLTILLKLGFFGLIFPFLFFYFLYRAFLYLKKTNKDSVLIEGVLCGLSGLLLAGLFGYFFHSPSFNIVFGSIVGTAAREVFKLDNP